LKAFTVEGVHYQLEGVKCGKAGCASCPHGPYWYAYWWSAGKQRKSYVGKRLPPNVNPPAEASAAPPIPVKTMTVREARKLLNAHHRDSVEFVQASYFAARDEAMHRVPLRDDLVRQLDEAWRVLMIEHGW
jgi:hypothetical protein